MNSKVSAALGEFSGMSRGRRALLATAGAWAVLGVLAALAALVLSTGTTLAPDSDRGPGTSRTVPYRWTGSALQVEALSSSGATTCDVVPDSGRPGGFPAPKPKSAAARHVRSEQPWFSGQATMTCSGTVTVRTGPALVARWLTQERIAQIAGVVVFFGPLIVTYVLTSQRFKSA